MSTEDELAETKGGVIRMGMHKWPVRRPQRPEEATSTTAPS